MAAEIAAALTVRDEPAWQECSRCEGDGLRRSLIGSIEDCGECAGRGEVRVP